ncbi:MAG: hypothetical protein IKE76_08730, partial [Clostridia bacterium]|nr:hypothetical protein [Clostridia bacterium]
MDYQSLHMKTVVDLRKLAKDMGVRVPAGTNKSVLIDMLLEADKAASAAPEAAAAAPEAAPRRRGRQPKKAEEPAKEKAEKPAKEKVEKPVK